VRDGVGAESRLRAGATETDDFSLEHMRDRRPNHALQRTAPRVTARAFCEPSGSYIWAFVVRATARHAPRHAPPSLSLGSFGGFHAFP